MEGWPRGERVTLTRQSCGRGTAVDGPGRQRPVASVLGDTQGIVGILLDLKPSVL